MGCCQVPASQRLDQPNNENYQSGTFQLYQRDRSAPPMRFSNFNCKQFVNVSPKRVVHLQTQVHPSVFYKERQYSCPHQAQSPIRCSTLQDQSVSFQSIKEQLTPKRPQEAKKPPVPISFTNDAVNLTFNANLIESQRKQIHQKSIQLGQLINKFGDQRQLIRAASHVISSIRSEKLNSENEQTVKELFAQLEKQEGMDQKVLDRTLSQLLENSREEIQSSLKISNRSCKQEKSESNLLLSSQKDDELQLMYEKMNKQLTLLNSLIVCLENKLTSQDKENCKSELKKISNKVQELATGANNLTKSPIDISKYQQRSSLEQQLKTLLNESRISMQSIKSSSGNIILTQLDQEKNKIYYKQFSQQSNNNTQAQKILSQVLNTQSTHLQSEDQVSQQSNKMNQNRQKIESLIHKLQDINESYKKISSSGSKLSEMQEDSKEKMTKFNIDKNPYSQLQNDRKQNFMKLLTQK